MTSFVKAVNATFSSAPLLSVHFATLLFGLAGVLGAAVGLGAVEVTFGRTLFASLALLLVCRGLQVPSSLDFKSTDTWLLLFSGILLAFHWVVFFATIQISTVAIGLITFSTCPVFTALLEPLFFREKWRGDYLAAALFVLIGVLIISGAATGEFSYIKGVVYGLISGFSFALLQLLNRRLTNANGALVTVTVQNSVAALVLLPMVFFSIKSFTVSQWAYLLVLGVFCTAIAQTLFINALQRVSVSIASLIAAGLEPVYGIIVAALLLSQKPEPNVIVGGVIVLGAVLFVTNKRRH